MKHLIAALLVTATAAALFVLGGCSGGGDLHGANLQGSVLSSGEIKVSDSIAAKIDKEKVYKKSNKKSLGLNCKAENTQALEILKTVEEGEILEFNYTGSKTAPLMIYKTINPNNLNSEEIRNMFKDCGSEKDNLPLKAESGYILWGSAKCDKGTVADKNKCEIFVEQLNEYLY